MRSHTATCSKDTLCSSHTSQVFWRCFDTNHNHFFAFSSPYSSIFSVEYDFTASSTWRSSQTFCQYNSFLLSFFVEYWVEKFVKFIRFNTEKSLFFSNHTLVEHIHSDFHHSSTCTFTVTCLEEPEFTFLNSELHILHITVVIFKFSLESIEFSIDFRHSLFH